MSSRLSNLPLKMVVCGAVMLTSCTGPNYFTAASNKNSDDALYYDALKLVDGKDYDGAITKIGKMTTAGQARVDVVQALAGAHAGNCGLDFLTFVGGFGSGATAFLSFMGGFTQVAVNLPECLAAQNTIENNFGSTAAGRLAFLGTQVGTNVNTFMAVLGMTKIGAQLRSLADVNQDGSVDAGFDSCMITDTNALPVASGFGLIMDNLAAIGGNLAGLNTAQITAFGAQCGVACQNTSESAAAWTAADLKIVKNITDTDVLGINNCDVTGHPFYPLDCCP